MTGKNYANTQKVLITGNIFNDLNSTGAKDAAETGLSGWKVFIDLNKNGLFDSN